MGASHYHIGFEVLSKDENTIILKRVISPRNRKNKDKEKIEMSLPKLSVHYFDVTELEHLQSIALELNNGTNKKETNKNFLYKLLELFRIIKYSVR